MLTASRVRVLEELIRSGKTSRAELARKTGLSRPTISSIIEALIAEGIVEELGEGPSAGGKRPILLRLNPRYGFVLGFDVGGTTITGGLKDLAGRLLAQRTVTASDPAEGASVLAKVEELACELMTAAGVPQSRLLAIGLGSPGIVDPETHETSNTTNIRGWDDLRVVHRLASRFRVPVLADNDVNMAARAELRFGHGRRHRSFVFVAIGTGIGAGIVIDGTLHFGTGGAAGEIAQMLLDRDALAEIYREKGYLETIVAAPGIRKEAARTAGPGAAALDVPDIFDADRRGVPWARALIDRVVLTLGMAVANIVCILAPEVVVLGGGVAAGNERLRAGVEEVVYQSVLRPVPVVLTELGREAGMLGAAQMALEHVYARLAHGEALEQAT